MEVHIVFCYVAYEGDYMHEVHGTLAGANAEVERLKTDHEHRHCDGHHIVSKEVKP